MTVRSMSFEIDELNPVFKSLSLGLLDSEASTKRILLKNSPFGHCMGIASVECCGWLEVSGLAGESPEVQGMIFNVLKMLMEQPLIIPQGSWSKVEYEEVRFPLFCVTTSVTVKKWLEENGWVPWPTWVNPNSGNTCMPFYWHS